METFAVIPAFVVCVICFVVGFVLISAPPKPLPPDHQPDSENPVGFSASGCGFLLLGAGVIAFLLLLSSLFGGD